MNNYCTITTVNKPTKAIEEWRKLFGDNLIIVADEKTPSDWECNGITPLQFEPKEYAPVNSYARKNAGYMEAIKNKADYIFSSDDDNSPNDKWKIRTADIEALEGIGEGWYNVYSLFSKEPLWPRGLSLRHIKQRDNVHCEFKQVRSSIQQGLVDGDPDVDAIWRLVFHTNEVLRDNHFTEPLSVYLKQGSWCPFNSQSTHWFPNAYALMYLPIHARFRMTDIWRSFIAQRCLWEIGEYLSFHSPSEVYQDRNKHDLLADFEDEIEGYKNNDKIVQILGKLHLREGQEHICENLIRCYRALVSKGILPAEEITSVKAWINDYEQFA